MSEEQVTGEQVAGRKGKGTRRSKRPGRGLLFGIAALWLALTAFGCTGKLFKEQRADQAALKETDQEEELIVVGVSQVGSESVWRTANTASIQKVFTKENGYFLIFKNARQKQENQIKALRSFISQRVGYIVFSPIMEMGWETVLQEAKEAGIPVIMIDRKAKVWDDSLYVAWIGPDFVREGRLAGEALEGCLKKQGRQDEELDILILRGTEGATATIGRTRGFMGLAEEHDNWNILEQVDGEFTTAKGQEVMERMLRRYDSIDVLISQNDDMTFGALEAIRKAGKTTGEDGDILVISFDAVDSALKLVEEGQITADVECRSDLGGYIEEVIQKLEKGEKVPRLNFVEEGVFTKENVAEKLDGE